MLYFSLFPKELRELFLLYVADRDIVTLLPFDEFKSLFDYISGTFWKLKVKEQYPNDYRENMPPLYYLNKATTHMEDNIANAALKLLRLYKDDPEYIELQKQRNAITKQIDNINSNLRNIERKYDQEANIYNNSPKLYSYAKQHRYVIRIINNEYNLIKIFFNYYRYADYLDRWLNLLPNREEVIGILQTNFSDLDNGTLIGIGTIKNKPDVLIYIYKNSSQTNKFNYDYSIRIDDKLALPTQFIDDMRQLALSANQILNSYNLPFKISDSDIYF